MSRRGGRAIDHAQNISGALLKQAAAHVDLADRSPLPARESDPVTLADLDRIVRIVLARCRTSQALGYLSDRYQVALSEVGLAIAEDPHLTFDDVIARASQSLARGLERDRQAAGRFIESERERGRGRAFQVYWTPSSGSSGFSDDIDDRVALHQVLSALPDRHLQALTAAAFTDGSDQAAKSLHTTRPWANKLIRAARQAAIELWYDQDTPPPLQHRDYRHRGDRLGVRTCPRGHEITGDNAGRTRRKTAGGGLKTYLVCRACQREQSAESIQRRRVHAELISPPGAGSEGGAS